MNETKLNWGDLQLFLAVARGGGLAAGAQLSKLSPPTLGRHMAALERAIGEPLFDRLPRGYRLTHAGEKLLADAEIAERHILSIERQHAGPMAQLPVHISAGSWMMRYLTQRVEQFRSANTRFIFQSAETQHNIGRRETTIGLRNTRPHEPGVAARKTVSIAFAVYSKPDARNQNTWIATTSETPSARWVRENHRDHIQFEATHPRSLLDLVSAGAGLAVLPCFVGDQAQGLVRVGPIISELTHDQWIVVHGEDRTRPQVRATVDNIANLIVSQRALFAGDEG